MSAVLHQDLTGMDAMQEQSAGKEMMMVAEWGK
jgi:hypothetical protein